MHKRIKNSPIPQWSQRICWENGSGVVPLLNYFAVRGSEEGIIFRFQDNSPLTKSKFVAKFQHLLDLASIDSTLYAGHSFRIGAATTAAANGVEDSTIQTLGRWKSSACHMYAFHPKL